MRLGEIFLEFLLKQFPDTYLLFGLPLFMIIGVLIIVALLAYFGGRIYRWDLKMVYGPVINKLEELISDIEELRD